MLIVEMGLLSWTKGQDRVIVKIRFNWLEVSTNILDNVNYLERILLKGSRDLHWFARVVIPALENVMNNLSELGMKVRRLQAWNPEIVTWDSSPFYIMMLFTMYRVHSYNHNANMNITADMLQHSLVLVHTCKYERPLVCLVVPTFVRFLF